MIIKILILGIFDLDGMRANRIIWDGLVDHTWR